MHYFSSGAHTPLFPLSRHFVCLNTSKKKFSLKSIPLNLTQLKHLQPKPKFSATIISGNIIFHLFRSISRDSTGTINQLLVFHHSKKHRHGDAGAKSHWENSMRHLELPLSYNICSVDRKSQNLHSGNLCNYRAKEKVIRRTGIK